MNNKNKYLPSLSGVETGLNHFSGYQGKNESDLNFSHQIDPGHLLCSVRSVNITSDNRYLIITFENNSNVKIFDLKRLEYHLPNSFKGHCESVRNTAVTNDDKCIVTTSWDGSARLWTLSTGVCKKIFSGFGASCAVFLDPENRYVYITSFTGDIQINGHNEAQRFDLITGQLLCKYPHRGQRLRPEAIDVSTDGIFVWTASDDGAIHKWDIDGNIVFTYDRLKCSIRKLFISKSFISIASSDGIIRIYYLSGEKFMDLEHGKNEVLKVRISNDESKLWSVSGNGSVCCFCLKSGQLLYNKKIHESTIWSFCLAFNETVLVLGSSDGTVSFLDSSTGNIIAKLMNLPNNDIIIECPSDSDEILKNGIFYTTNVDYIRVFSVDQENRRRELGCDDPERIAYIKKTNLKNLIITKLKNNHNYNLIKTQFLEKQKTLNELHELHDHKMPLAIGNGARFKRSIPGNF